MLESDSHLRESVDINIRVISPEGILIRITLSEDVLVEEIKNRATARYYPEESNVGSRYKIVRINNFVTLREFLSLRQENICEGDELMLVERGVDAGVLWDPGSVRAPTPAIIAATTSTLPTTSFANRQPDLQSLLTTDELTHDLRKVLISLIEVGAKLAAGGRNYNLTLNLLSEALDEDFIDAPYEMLSESLSKTHETYDENELFKRATHLIMFLDKFHTWCLKVSPKPDSENVNTLTQMGFSEEEAINALIKTGCNEPAAALMLVGEAGSSLMELVNGLPTDGTLIQAILKQHTIQRGLLNTRMLLAFISMVRQRGSVALWLNVPRGSSLLTQILRTYHSEKYCLAVNQFSSNNSPSTSGH